jgi:DNA-binding response OmpR family regulator
MRSGISTTVSTLVIDSDTPTSSVLCCALAGQGYLVAQARSCGEAFRRILHTPVDLVLLDTEATGFDGMETCRRLHLAVPQASIVVITVVTVRKREFRRWMPGQTTASPNHSLSRYFLPGYIL